MVKVFLKSGRIITFELGDEKKELNLVTRFHGGLDGNTVLNLKTGARGAAERITVSEIKNMQCLKAGADKAAPDAQDSKFKTREEYEKWKEQKMKESKSSAEKMK